MAKVHYLTVQDVIWINLQVSHKVNHFQFARLEEATFCQYASGGQPSFETQAARLISGLMRLHPFSAANDATALVACEAFLNLNGHELTINDDLAPQWIGAVIDGQNSAKEAMAGNTKAVEGEFIGDVRKPIQSALKKFECTVEQLVEQSSRLVL